MLVAIILNIKVRGSVSERYKIKLIKSEVMKKNMTLQYQYDENNFGEFMLLNICETAIASKETNKSAFVVLTNIIQGLGLIKSFKTKYKDAKIDNKLSTMVKTGVVVLKYPSSL